MWFWLHTIYSFTDNWYVSISLVAVHDTHLLSPYHLPIYLMITHRSFRYRTFGINFLNHSASLSTSLLHTVMAQLISITIFIIAAITINRFNPIYHSFFLSQNSAFPKGVSFIDTELIALISWVLSCSFVFQQNVAISLQCVRLLSWCVVCCLSVVTRVYCDKTAQVRVMHFL